MDRRIYSHSGDAGGNLRPKVVYEGIEIGKSMELQDGMVLIQHC